MARWYSSSSLAAAVFTMLLAAPAQADPYDSAPPYAKPILPGADLTPIVTTGQLIPNLDGAAGATYRFLGIPDGMGILRAQTSGRPELQTPVGGPFRLLVHHEFGKAAGQPAGPFNSGARISELEIGPGGGGWIATGGRFAIENVYAGSPPALQAPGTRTLSRLCSAFLADGEVGFDRAIFLGGEEDGAAANTFDGLGGSAFALVGRDYFQLPKLGHFPWENAVVGYGTEAKTVVFGLEDGSSAGDSQNSQLYMYVGTKDAAAPDALNRNGLDNGALYVLVSNDGSRKDEATFTVKGTTVPCEWKQVDYTLDQVALDTQSKGLGSFNFVRIEDGANDRRIPGVFYFGTTGRPGSVNPLGRIYRLEFSAADPTAPCRLTLVLDGSEGIISPDNLDLDRNGNMVVCEDPNPVLVGRDTYLWRYNVDSQQLDVVAEIDKAAAEAHALAADPLNQSLVYQPGSWEFSGVVDAEAVAGAGRWLLNIQAHTLRINPAAETVEGGQVLLLSIDQATPVRDGIRMGIDADAEGVRLNWVTTGGRYDQFRISRSDRAQGGPWTPIATLPGTAAEYTDRPSAGIWYYQLEAVRGTQVVETTSPIEAQVRGPVLGLSFASAYPNPTQGPVRLSYAIPAALAGTSVELGIYDLGGRLVRSVVSGAAQAGAMEAHWDGRDAAGRPVGAGLYYARLGTVNGDLKRRIVVTR